MTEPPLTFKTLPIALIAACVVAFVLFVGWVVIIPAALLVWVLRLAGRHSNVFVDPLERCL